MPASGLCVIIPVWNDHAGLNRLLPQLLALPQILQIIVVDDASDPPVSPETLDLGELAGDRRLTWLRSPVQKGAGHARNQGLAQVRCSHLLYFDSDDLILPGADGLDGLLDELLTPDAPEFDFCMFRHVESRRRALGRPGPLESDQRHWERAGITTPSPVPLEPGQAARLARVSAYPWNKIYRTAFLRDKGLRCTEIRVHNDIELHWRSFFHAGRILASSRLCAEHFVQEDGNRLTNRTGADRFEVFSALGPVQADIAAGRARAAQYAEALAEFYLSLFHWIEHRLDPPLRAAFRRKAQAFIAAGFDLPFFTLIATRDAGLARRVNDFLARDAA